MDTDSSLGDSIRPATPADGDALGRLFENSPDGGAISFAPRFSFDPYTAYTGLRPETTAFVIDTPETDGELAAVGFLSFTEARFGGERRPAALLNALAVHPDYRGRGLAKRLATHRIEYARQKLGEECVVFANIQAGNDPSLAVAHSWADTLTYPFVMYPAEPRAHPPTHAKYDVHELQPAETSAAVAGSNRFYADSEVYRPYSVAGLESRLTTSPIEETIHRYLVATVDSEVVAGAFVSDLYRVMALVVDSLPPELEGDQLPTVIPESRALEMAMVADCWYAPGELEAAQALWETIRATSGGANRVMFNVDPEGPVAEVVSLRPDEMTLDLSVAVAGVDPETLVSDSYVAPLF